MRPIQRFIHAGFATAAIASASVPALAWTAWPDVDFEWYANVGRQPVAAPTIEIDAPASAEQANDTGAGSGEGPARDRTRAAGEDRVIHRRSTYSTTPGVIRDREGNAIPTSPDAYPVDRTR